MFIELTGMVGAGKTVGAIALRELLEERGLTALSMHEAVNRSLHRSQLGQVLGRLRLPEPWPFRILRWLYKYCIRPYYWFRFVLQYPGLTWIVYRSQLRRALPWWHRKRIIDLFFWVAAGHHFVRQRLASHEVLVLEEGFVHRALNLFAWQMKGVDPDALEAYFNHLPTFDLVIIVKAPLEVCLDRVKARGLPARVADKDPAVIDRFMSNAADIMEITTAYLMSGERRAIQIDNSGRIEEMVSSLASTLRLTRSGVQPAGQPSGTGRI